VVFADWITFSATASTLFVYRARARRAGSDPTTFLTPGYPVTPLLFIAAGIYVVIGSVASNPGNALKGTALLLAGIPVYLFWKGKAAAA
jgi:APA family basic amino acid/polyamine antiporter